MNIAATVPELFIAITAILMMLYAAWQGDKGAAKAASLGLLSITLTATLVVSFYRTPLGEAMNGMFIDDTLGRFLKLVLLGAAGAVLLMSSKVMAAHHISRPEFPVLILFAALGMMLMVSANDLMALYVGLELQSMALYVLAAFRRDHMASSEAGMKYFVLSAIASAVLLYGLSLLYGFAGSTRFDVLATVITSARPIAPGVLMGLVFVTAALAFKMAAAPFHMWAPDVYEGTPTPVTAFFAVAPKIAAVGLAARLFMHPFMGLHEPARQIIVFVSVASMALGSLAGLAQTNIKRLMAYSSIVHMGTVLAALAAGGEGGVQAMLVYLVIYALGALGTFSVILSLRRGGEAANDIKDLAGLSSTHPWLAAAMAAFLFSLAGVPPLAGFFGKYVVFLAVVKEGMTPLAFVGVVASVIAAVYYLRMIKLMYFDQPATAPVDPVTEKPLAFVMGATALIVVALAIYPAPLLDRAMDAARALPMASVGGMPS